MRLAGERPQEGRGDEWHEAALGVGGDAADIGLWLEVQHLLDHEVGLGDGGAALVREAFIGRDVGQDVARARRREAAIEIVQRLGLTISDENDALHPCLS